MNLKFLFAIAFSFLTSLALTQSIGRDVISVSGGQKTTGDLQLSWTIGQSGLAGSLIHSTSILSQGFEQDNDDMFVAVIKIGLHDLSIDLFPNPVMEKAFLKFTSEIRVGCLWKLLDSKGVLILTGESTVYPGSVIEQIPTSGLNTGLYYLQITLNHALEKPVLKTLKLVKI